MRIDYPAETAALRQLWKDAFGDDDAFLDRFFRYGYDPQKCRCVFFGSELVSVLYWLDCEFRGQKLAYLYAIATAPVHRGKGLFRALMEDTHALLARKGYAGILLVPAKPELFSLYEKLGYRVCSSVDSLSCSAEMPIPLRKLTADEYARLRREYLPQDGVLQENAMLVFLESYSGLYAGEDFLLAGYGENGVFHGSELLGNPAAAPGILAALGMEKGSFRIPGNAAPFAMYFPLSDLPAPSYFGLAMD